MPKRQLPIVRYNGFIKASKSRFNLTHTRAQDFYRRFKAELGKPPKPSDITRHGKSAKLAARQSATRLTSYQQAVRGILNVPVVHILPKLTIAGRPEVIGRGAGGYIAAGEREIEELYDEEYFIEEWPGDEEVYAGEGG